MAFGNKSYTLPNGDILTLDGAKLSAALGYTGGIVYKTILKVVTKGEANAKQRCPVDTGRLRSSITSRVEISLGKELIVGVVGSNVEYAPYVEFGARGRAPVGFLRGGVEQAISEVL